MTGFFFAMGVVIAFLLVLEIADYMAWKHRNRK